MNAQLQATANSAVYPAYTFGELYIGGSWRPCRAGTTRRRLQVRSTRRSLDGTPFNGADRE
jgi:hypothetical protein